jgi:hypothetical protein
MPDYTYPKHQSFEAFRQAILDNFGKAVVARVYLVVANGYGMTIGQTKYTADQLLTQFKEPLQNWVKQHGGTVPDEKKGCYVATAVYGSYDCSQVWVLRRYRDRRLTASMPGRVFTKCYYTISPALVQAFGQSVWFNRLLKKRLDKLVHSLMQQGYNNTAYYD